MNLTVKAMDRSLIEDFRRVHCEQNELDWCQCTAWWCPTWEEFGKRTAAQNQSHRDDLFRQGIFDGFLLYENSLAIGWSQFGLRDRLAKGETGAGVSSDKD